MKWPEDLNKPQTMKIIIILKNIFLYKSFNIFVALLVLLGLLIQTNGSEGAASEKVLTLGVRADAPPFSYVVKEADGEDSGGSGETEGSEGPEVRNGAKKYRGYTVELCDRIADRAIDRGLYCEIKYMEVTAENRFKLLSEGKIDMLCGATTVTLERMRVANFSLFTFLSGASVMYPESLSSDKKEEITTFRIGVLEGTTTREEMDRIVKKLRKTSNEPLWRKVNRTEPVVVSSHLHGREFLLDGKIHAYLADREILLELNQIPTKQEDTDRPDKVDLVVSKAYLTVEPYAIGIHRDARELQFVANTVLSEMFEWNLPRDGHTHIFEVLSRQFPGKKFTKSLADMFRIQRLQLGRRLVDFPNPVDCQ